MRSEGTSAGRGIRVSLAAKLIVAIAALLAAAVGASAWSSLRTIVGLAATEAHERRAWEETALQRHMERLARSTAASAALPVAEGNFTYLESLVDTTAQEDRRIVWMLIADEPTRRILARSAGAPAGQTLDDGLRETVLATPGVIGQRDRSDRTRFVFGARLQLEKRVVGQLRMAVSTAELEAELARSIAQARLRARSSAREVVLVAAGILLLGVALGALQGFRMARPLHALSEQAARIAGGDLDRRVDIRSRDEIGLLANNFNFMAARLRALVAETASKASLDHEMALARQVQEAMLPPDHVHVHGPLRVIGHCKPATTCGGDWWSLHMLPQHRVLIVVADVTGHGIPSAMLTANARGALEALAQTDQKLLRPEHVLRALDGAVVGSHRLLMSCFAALVDPEHGTLEYANAGHNFPYLFHMDAQSRQFATVSVLSGSGNWLGGGSGLYLAKSGRIELRRGDLLVCFTDGVVERENEAGRTFGDRRLCKLVMQRQASADPAQLEALRDSIVRSVDEFAAGCPAHDDVTLVLCQYDPDAATMARPVSHREAAR